LSTPDLPVDPFAPERIALERGDYGLVIRSLEAQVQVFPPATTQGAELQLLLATAWMGQGNTLRAMACCRQVQRCSDATLRAQAKDLLSVLEAPALERPRDWSITLPPLGDSAPMAGRMQQWARGRRNKKSDEPPPPPVGPTQAPVGFAVLAVVVLLLSLLLGGCVEVQTDLHFKGPGRLQIGYQLTSSQVPMPPWQRQFSQILRSSGLHQTPDTRGGKGPDPRRLSLESPVMASAKAIALVRANGAAAAALAGLTLPPPGVELNERNWLVGVRQTLLVSIDLREMQPIPGVRLSMALDPVGVAGVRRAEPESVTALPKSHARSSNGLHWPLRFGALNQLELRCWRWSPLGLGGLGIGLALVVVLSLQRLRLLLGFGLPQLPA
jgi:hypothetical protein